MTPKQIKNWREKLGWTQDFGAFFLAMPYETYRSVETGRRKPLPALEAQIARKYTASYVSVIRQKYERFVKRRVRLRQAAAVV